MSEHAGTTPVPAPAPALPGLWQLTALVLADIGDALEQTGGALLARAEAQDPQRNRIALTLERAAAHIRGEPWDPPTEALRQLHRVAPRLLELALELAEAATHPNAPMSAQSLTEFTALVRPFAGEKFHGRGP